MSLRLAMTGLVGLIMGASLPSFAAESTPPSNSIIKQQQQTADGDFYQLQCWKKTETDVLLENFVLGNETAPVEGTYFNDGKYRCLFMHTHRLSPKIRKKESMDTT